MEPYYQDDHCTIFHGDCLEILPTIDAEVMVTDPPYGMNYKSGWSGRGFGDCSVKNDSDSTARDKVLEIWGDRPALVFGRWSIPRPSNTRMVLIWEKGNHTGMGDLSTPWKPTVEEIYVIGRGFEGRRDSCVLRYNAPPPAASLGRSHPTEKPIGLMRSLLSKCPKGLIIDPFAGSGSTLRAAKDLGRKAVGIEMEERYCETAALRLSQEVMFV